MKKEVYTVKSYEEYLCILFLYIGYADSTLDQSEIDMILIKMEDMFPSQFDLSEIFVQTQNLFKEKDDKEIEKIIKKNFNIYSFNRTQSDKIFGDLHKVIMADGIIHESELFAIEKLKVLLKK